MTGDISNFRWVKTNAPPASSRTDDIWFLDENVGWAVNSNGQILKTERRLSVLRAAGAPEEQLFAVRSLRQCRRGVGGHS
jgi:hypothetical protein